MSSGADINAGGATVYLNLATNARNANVAAAIRNELHQVQNVTRIFSNVTHNSLTNVTGIWNRTTTNIVQGAGAARQALHALAAKFANDLTMFGANLTTIGSRMSSWGRQGLGFFQGVLSEFAGSGDVWSKLADKTGAEAEALSALGYAAERSGVGVGALTQGLAKMQDNLAGAAAKGGSLRLGALDLDPAVLKGDATARFRALAQAIAGIADPAQRTQAAFDAFGRGGAELLPLLTQGERGIAALEARARALGLTFSNADAAAATALGDLLADLRASATALGRTIAATLAPEVSRLAKWLAGALPAIREWLREHGGLAKVAALAAGALATLGGAVTALGMAIGVATPAIVAIMGFFTSLPGLLTAAGAGLVAWLVGWGDLWKLARDYVAENFGEIVAKVGEGAKTVAKLLGKGEFKAAAEVGVTAIKLAYAVGIDWLQTKWGRFKDWFLSWWEGLRTPVLLTATALWGDLEQGAIKCVAYLKRLWIGFGPVVENVFRTLAKTVIDFYGGLFSSLATVAESVGADEIAANLRLAAAGGKLLAADQEAKRLQRNQEWAKEDAAAQRAAAARAAQRDKETNDLMAAIAAGATEAGQARRAELAQAEAERAAEVAALRQDLGAQVEKANGLLASLDAETAAANQKADKAAADRQLGFYGAGRGGTSGSFNAFARLDGAGTRAQEETAKRMRDQVELQRKTKEGIDKLVAAGGGGVPVA